MNKIEAKIKYWEEQKEGYHESNIKYTNICQFIDDLKELDSMNLVPKDKIIEYLEDHTPKAFMVGFKSWLDRITK